MSQTKTKDFDAVKIMRAIRDDLSRKLMTMSHEEQDRYIKEQLETGEGPEKQEFPQHSTA